MVRGICKTREKEKETMKEYEKGHCRRGVAEGYKRTFFYYIIRYGVIFIFILRKQLSVKVRM